MAEQGAIHSTFVIEKSYPKSPEKVFAAFSDAAKKKRWYGESRGHDIGEYKLDFRVGGHELLAVTMKPGTPIAGAVLRWAQTYDDIKENSRIVFSQTLDINGKRISVALITAEFRASKTGCDLVFTHQAAFLEGADGPQMREAGWKALLGNLEKELAA